MNIFLSCVSKKADKPCRAREMYVSALFKGAWKYATETLEEARSAAKEKQAQPTPEAGQIWILSAKYGLLNPETVIEPYNLTLNDMSDAEKRRWAAWVYRQMKDAGIRFDEKAVFLCGENYRKYLTPLFRDAEAPMRGLSIGKQLQFLRRQ